MRWVNEQERVKLNTQESGHSGLFTPSVLAEGSRRSRMFERGSRRAPTDVPLPPHTEQRRYVPHGMLHAQISARSGDRI